MSDVLRLRRLGHPHRCKLYSIRHRPHLLQVALKHHVPAFLDEEYPIIVDVMNVDDRPLDVVLDVLLQPTEIDEAGRLFEPLSQCIAKSSS